MSVTIIASIIGAAIIVVGTLIVLNLRSIKHGVRGVDQRVNKTEDNVKNVQLGFSACKVDCERTFVDKELFLRETGFTRRSLENLNASVNRLDGKLTVVEKLPQICGDISREIVKEMRNGQNGNRT